MGLGLGRGVGYRSSFDAALGWPGYYYPYAAYPYAPYPYYVPAAPAVTVVQQAPPVMAPPAPAAAPAAAAVSAQSYYYCNKPKGYYPYGAVLQ